MHCRYNTTKIVSVHVIIIQHVVTFLLFYSYCSMLSKHQKLELSKMFHIRLVTLLQREQNSLFLKVTKCFLCILAQIFLSEDANKCWRFVWCEGNWVYYFWITRFAYYWCQICIMTVFLNKFFYLVNFLTELNFISTVIVTNSQSDQENKKAAENFLLIITDYLDYTELSQ